MRDARLDGGCDEPSVMFWDGMAASEERGLFIGRYAFFQPFNTALELLDSLTAVGVARLNCGDEQGICLILLGPEAIGVKLQQLPDEAFERHQQEGETATSFADFEVGEIDGCCFAETLEVELQELVCTGKIGKVGLFGPGYAGINIRALLGLGSNSLPNLFDKVVHIHAFRSDAEDIIYHVLIIGLGQRSVKSTWGLAGAHSTSVGFC
jgi:hypothetical protein